MTRLADRTRGKPRRLRPPGSDDLGLRRALSDRLLPLLVGAMAFLAALGLAGVLAASGLARHWQQGAGASLTVQVPEPEQDGRLARVLAVLHATAGVREAHALTSQELEALLKPWLGSGEGRIALTLPAVIAVRFTGPGPDTATLGARLQTEAPGTLIEAQDIWIGRLRVLAWSLQACAGLAMGVVGLVAVAVVMVATRAGLAARRDAIEIVHGLGAADGYIAGRFARRATWLAAVGGLGGAALALPVLLGLVGLAAPFAGGAAPEDLASLVSALPPPLWFGLPALPLLAGAVGWITSQTTVRRWLRRLP